MSARNSHYSNNLYSPSPLYWTQPSAPVPVLRSSWSTSTSTPTSKRQTYGKQHNRHSQTSSSSYSTHSYYTDSDLNDEENKRQLHIRRRSSSYGHPANLKQKRQHLYPIDLNEQDYNNMMNEPMVFSHSKTHRRLQSNYSSSQQSEPRQRRQKASSTDSSNNNKKMIRSKPSSLPPAAIKPHIRRSKSISIENSNTNSTTIDPSLRYAAPASNEQLHVQRKPLMRQRSTQPNSIITNTAMDTNCHSSDYHQMPTESTRLGHYTNNNNNNNNSSSAGWKMSAQYDHLVLRSPLSPTPPSLYESSSTTSSATLSSISDSQRNNNPNTSMLNMNGLIYHRKSSNGVKHTVTKSQQRKHTTPKTTIATTAATAPFSSSSSSSSSLSSAHQVQQRPLVKPSSTGSLSTRSRYSYDEYPRQQNSVMSERPRRHSQGDCSSITSLQQRQRQQQQPWMTPGRVSTPKLRRVMSAKPCVKHLTHDKRSKTGEDDDELLSAMDAASLSAAKKIINSTTTCSSTKTDTSNSITNNKEMAPTFWNPRSESDIIPVKRTLSRRLRGLLLPQRSKLDNSVSKDHRNLTADQEWSVTRPMTPIDVIGFDNDCLLEDQENGVMTNPFYMISQSWNIADQTGLIFTQDDFTQMDTYAASVQQRGPSLTPQILAQKFLVRPYRRDLYRLRIIYIWMMQNIGILDQRTPNTNEESPAHTTTTTTTTTSSSTKISLRQRLTTRRLSTDREEELDIPTMDVMHGDGLLPEGGGDVDSFDDWLFSESANQVLLRRTCSSSIGMANLFCDMAIAAGIHDVRVVYGYLRAPKDSIDTASMNPNKNDNDDDVTLVQNHAWCCVKVEGEYRFVDCWLASPFQPQNKNMMESHWFLTKPSDMIYTHFPQEPEDQCLEPVIHVSTFFALPYVWAPFFSHHLKMIRYDPAMLTLMDDQVCHLTFRVDPQVICFAFVETSEEEEQQKSITIRCLAQCRMIPGENGELERVYKIKAVLPPGHNQGWLKIYAGHIQHITSSIQDNSNSNNNSNNNNNNNNNNNSNNNNNNSVISESLPPLALCFPLTAKQTQPQLDRSFEFVQLHPCRYEFYIQEPQCYSLYPLQTYNFLVRGAADDLHHKLAIRSPSGKLYKLMYYPQERSYDGSVKIVETGKWCLICLLHHASGWYVVATWECHG